MFLVSFSTVRNKVVDVLNIYNDGVMLYWECERFFYIDANLEIHLKDYSIKERDYTNINEQVFTMSPDGHFKRDAARSLKETPKKDSLQSDFIWNGSYTFSEVFLRNMDEFEITYSINITNERSAHLLSKVNDRIKEYTVNVTSFNSDILVLNYMDNNDNAEELILYKTKEGYEIGGQSIYLLNPPNEKYPIVKQ